MHFKIISIVELSHAETASWSVFPFNAKPVINHITLNYTLFFGQHFVWFFTFETVSLGYVVVLLLLKIRCCRAFMSSDFGILQGFIAIGASVNEKSYIFDCFASIHKHIKLKIEIKIVSIKYLTKKELYGNKHFQLYIFFLNILCQTPTNNFGTTFRKN